MLIFYIGVWQTTICEICTVYHYVKWPLPREGLTITQITQACINEFVSCESWYEPAQQPWELPKTETASRRLEGLLSGVLSEAGLPLCDVSCSCLKKTTLECEPKIMALLNRIHGMMSQACVYSTHGKPWCHTMKLITGAPNSPHFLNRYLGNT